VYEVVRYDGVTFPSEVTSNYYVILELACFHTKCECVCACVQDLMCMVRVDLHLSLSLHRPGNSHC